MTRYFKVTEIEHDEYVNAVGEDTPVSCSESVPVDDNVYVAVNADSEDEGVFYLDQFDL